jgi:hypothetical protein
MPRQCRQCYITIPAFREHHFNGYIYCRACFQSLQKECTICGVSHNIASMRVDPEGGPVCPNCFTRYFVVCSNCGNTIRIPDSQTIFEEAYCRECARRLCEWQEGEFSTKNLHFEGMPSHRGYGIELETATCDGFQELNGNTIWGCHKDSSIEGMEFISPILYGDEGFIEIKNFCAFAKKKDFRVNRLCGYHVHFDMRNETEDSLKAIAYAYSLTYPMWCALVPDNRSENAYCGSPEYDSRYVILEDWDYFVGKCDRFEYVNWRAYLVHGSMEIRLYQGTLNATEICNWVLIHSLFIESVKSMTFDSIKELFAWGICGQFEALEASINNNELSDYWAAKSIACGKHVRNLTRPLSYDIVDSEGVTFSLNEEF